MATDMQLVIGLGNPGLAYRGHRHNIGFRVVEALARRRGWSFVGEDAAYALATAPAEGDGLVLLQPQTYMNLSGEAVVAWSRRAAQPVTGAPLAPATPSQSALDPIPTAPVPTLPTPTAPTPGLRPLVICDDLALPLGSVRLRARGGSGGQNGLASIIATLGGEEFPRLRLGVAPPSDLLNPAAWADHVLSDFAADETAAVGEMVQHACLAVECWLDDGLEAAASRFNRRGGPAVA